MFKLNSKMPVIPPSLIVTGVSIPAELDYIGSGGFGRVFTGKLRGAAVALKVLYKSDNVVVGCSRRRCYESILDLCITGLLSRGVDVGLS
jgi:hypothetical protein